MVVIVIVVVVFVGDSRTQGALAAVVVCFAQRQTPLASVPNTF